jgi:hypothetical protein
VNRTGAEQGRWWVVPLGEQVSVFRKGWSFNLRTGELALAPPAQDKHLFHNNPTHFHFADITVAFRKCKTPCWGGVQRLKGSVETPTGREQHI